MNKILNINLGGYAITIDDDAYEYLSAYLESIRRRFHESEGRDEILNDIETRLGEIITQSLGTRTIVMLPDVEAAVQVMGKPEEFGADPIDTKSKNGRPAGASIRTGKRLFRDEDDKVAGGVCAGLSAYFGIQDPVWMRLIFVLLTFISAGFWVPAYLLLWVLIPPAKTSADRLAMRGEPINVNNIAREIEDGFETIGKRVNDLGSEAKKKGHDAGSGFARGLGAFVTAIGQIFAFAVRFFLKFGVLIAIAIGLGVFAALAVGWIAGIGTLISAAPVLDYFSPVSSGLTWLAMGNLFFLFGIPIVLLFLLFVRVAFRKRTPGVVSAGLGLFWVINLISVAVVGGLGASEYRQSSILSKSYDLSEITSDTLRVEWAGRLENLRDDHQWFRFEGLRYNDEKMSMEGPVDLRVRPANGSRFECTQTIRAFGRDNTEAVENAGKVEFPILVENNFLRVPTEYALPKGAKWRAQNIMVTLHIPIGKYVIFGETINNRVHDTDYADRDGNYYIFDNPGRVYQMTEQGLVCIDCPTFGQKGYRGGRSYENFILEGNFNTEIRHGDDFFFTIEGDKKDVEVIRGGDQLTFTTNGKPVNSDVRVLITAPVFTRLIADNTGEVNIRGFNEGQTVITGRGASKIKAYFDSNRLEVSLSDDSSLDLIGQGNDLDAIVRDNARLDASKWSVNQARLKATDKAKVRLLVEERAKINRDPSSEVDVDGNAEIEEERGEKI